MGLYLAFRPMETTTVTLGVFPPAKALDMEQRLGWVLVQIGTEDPANPFPLPYGTLATVELTGQMMDWARNFLPTGFITPT